MRVLLSSTVLLDLLGDADDEAGGLTQLKVMHEFGDVELWTSARSFMVLVAALEEAEDAAHAKAAAADVLSWLRVCPVGEAEARDALAKGGSGFVGSLDAICADRVRADFLVTDDGRAGDLTLVPSGSAADLMDFVCGRLNIRYDIVDF